MQSPADLILVSSHVPTKYLAKHRIYFLDGIFKDESEKYRIYEVGLNQSQFSISVQGIIIQLIAGLFVNCGYVKWVEWSIRKY